MLSVASTSLQSLPPGYSSTAIHFYPGANDLAQGAAQELNALALSLAGKPHQIEIRGLARSPDDLDHAWQRAKAAAQLLLETGQIEHTRLRISVLAPVGTIVTSGPTDSAEKPMVEVIVHDEPQSLAARPSMAR